MGSNANIIDRRAAASLVATVLAVLAPAGSAVTAPTTPDAPPTAATSSAPGRMIDEVLEALVLSTIDVAPNLAFPRSDGDHIWATGRDGLVVRVDPSSGVVDELVIDGLDGRLLPTVADGAIWLAELGASHVVRIDRATLEAEPPLEVAGPVGLVVAGSDGRLWIESSEPPAGLRPFDPVAGTTGELVVVDDRGEVAGSAWGFGSLWAPRFEGNEIVRLDADGAPLGTVATGVGPADVRPVGDRLWFVNRIDGTLGRLDPGTLDVVTVDLNAGGPPIDTPSGVVGNSDDVWTLAASIVDGTAIVFRVDARTGEVIARRTAPQGLHIDAVGGLAMVGDRLFLLTTSTAELLELDVDDFTTEANPARSVPTTPLTSDDEAAVRSALETLFASTTTTDEMAERIDRGATLTTAIAAFKQFFDDNFAGQTVGANVIGVRVVDDRAEADYTITVSGAPIIEVQTAALIRAGDGAWQLERTSFCALVALGGIDCEL